MKSTGNPLIDNSTAKWVIGSDEAGLGAYAGPLAVAGTALPRGWSSPDVVVNDSKEMPEAQREAAFRKWTIESPVLFVLCMIGHEEIDQMGVQKALVKAHRTVLTKLLDLVPCPDPLIVVDGFKSHVHQLGVTGAIGLPKADSLIPAVSLASIIAKVSRDTLMKEYGLQYPQYNFQKHKGYGTTDHQAALDLHGVCPIHRRSYGPIAKLIKQAKPPEEPQESWGSFLIDD